MTTLVRTVSVLQLGEDSLEGLKTFPHSDGDETPRGSRMLVMSPEDWRDMGEPQEITIVIYPGDVIDDLAYHVEEPMLNKVTIHESTDDQWFIRGVGKNGEPLWVSETYTDIRNARKHANSYGVPVEGADSE